MTITVAGLAVVTAISYLGESGWVFELVSHFCPQLAAAALITLLISACRKQTGAALLATLVLVANLAPLLPYILPGDGTKISALSGNRFRVLTLNLHGEHTTPEAFAGLIAAEQPDIVVLTELPTDSDRLLALIQPPFPHVLIDRHGGSPFDVAVLSRWLPITGTVDRSINPFLPVLIRQSHLKMSPGFPSTGF
ncbi:MAG: endonuclease/exonuclease/phosphatase family protein, partial [Rhodospirillaceae bacterium]